MKFKTLLMVMGWLCCTALTAQQSAFSGKTVADEGAWCWFADPRALHYENESGTINATYIGYIDCHGSIKATQVDWKTKTTSEVLIRSWFQPDDHDNPSFLVLPDERIMIIYSRHTDEACFYYRISRLPGDITSLGEEKRLATANNTTYPNPYILSDDPDHIYMCWRGIGWHPTVAQMSMPDENDDIKFTWGPYQMVQSTGSRPYAKYMSNGKDKIYLAYTTGHPDNEYPNWLYCNVFDVNDKCLYDLNGKKLSTVASGKFNVSKTDSYKTSYPATVVDATADRRDWIWNMAFDTKGNPVIGMTKISNDKQQHDYYYAKWTGSKWNVTFVANGGKYFHHSSNTENCYSSGMAIDRDNPNTVYCGVPVNGIHEIWKYTLDNTGKVTASEAVTSGSTKSNARPFVIEGTKNAKDGADKLRLTWMNGDYYYWIVNTTYPKGYPTSIMAETELPHNLTASKGTTLTVENMLIDPTNYKGDLLKTGSIVYGVDATDQHAYVKVNGETHKSQNVLGTADSWQTEDRATTDGRWYSKTKLGRFNLALTCDGKFLTVYVNGLIDMKIAYTGSLTANAPVLYDNATATTTKFQPVCLTQDMIKASILEQELENISVTKNVVTDIVLPTTTASGKVITWTSSNEEVLSTSGIANLPKVSATKVTLTAHVEGKSRQFEVVVNPRKISQNVRARFEFEGKDTGLTLKGSAKLANGKLDLTGNTAAGFSTNGYALVDEGLLKGLRSYTVLLTVKPSSLSNAPRLYDFGAGSGNSVFLRANALSAGTKLNGGTTTMVNANTALATGKEYKLAVTFDAATKTTTLYVDGVLDAAGTANQNEPYMIYESAGDARNYIGRTQWWDNSGVAATNVDFVGTMDNFMVYDIALTQKEVCEAQGLPFEQAAYKAALENGDLEGKYTVMKGSGVSSDRAIYVPEGWAVDYSLRNENDITALKSGDLYYSNFFSSRTKAPQGGSQTMWVRQRWGTSMIDFYQELCLKKGRYELSADAFANVTEKSWVYADRVQKSPSQPNVWQTATILLESDGETPIRIGMKTSHPESEGELIFGFDNFVLRRLPIAGDANDDGEISLLDVEYLLEVILGKAERTPGCYVNTDDEVTISDLSALIDLLQGR